MQDFILVQFYEENKAAKLKKKSAYRYHIKRRDLKIEKGSYLVILSVYLPLYFMGQKPMTKEQKRDYFAGMPIPKEGPFCHYSIEPGERLSDEWGVLILKKAGIKPTTLICLSDKKTDLLTWVGPTMKFVHDYYLITEDFEQAEIYQEALSDEYGITLQVAASLKGILKRNRRGVLLITGECLYDLTPNTLKKMDYLITLKESEVRRLKKCADDVCFLELDSLLES